MVLLNEGEVQRGLRASVALIRAIDDPAMKKSVAMEHMFHESEQFCRAACGTSSAWGPAAPCFACHEGTPR